MSELIPKTIEAILTLGIWVIVGCIIALAFYLVHLMIEGLTKMVWGPPPEITVLAVGEVECPHCSKIFDIKKYATDEHDCYVKGLFRQSPLALEMNQ